MPNRSTGCSASLDDFAVGLVVDACTTGFLVQPGHGGMYYGKTLRGHRTPRARADSRHLAPRTCSQLQEKK